MKNTPAMRQRCALLLLIIAGAAALLPTRGIGAAPRSAVPARSLAVRLAEVPDEAAAETPAAAATETPAQAGFGETGSPSVPSWEKMTSGKLTSSGKGYDLKGLAMMAVAFSAVGGLGYVAGQFGIR